MQTRPGRAHQWGNWHTKYCLPGMSTGIGGMMTHRRKYLQRAKLRG